MPAYKDKERNTTHGMLLFTIRIFKERERKKRKEDSSDKNMLLNLKENF